MSISLEALVAELRDLAPLELAEPWDCVGLLVEPPSMKPIQHVLLCIDLTEVILEEARQMRAQFILAYHPVIFGGLDRITQAVPIQRVVSLALCARIAVYSPHTALDCMVGGVNDWLVQGLGQGRVWSIQPRFCEAQEDGSQDAGPGASQDTREDGGEESAQDPRPGQGRVLELDKPQPIKTLLRRIKKHLDLKQLRVALAERHARGEAIKRILVCAGAGGSVVEGQMGDLVLTGEMKHHEVLAHRERGVTVVLAEHSNTERGYLPLLRECLQERLGKRARVLVSEVDRDPLAWL